MSDCYLYSKEKKSCFGCEACAQICGIGAIRMGEDQEGFRYPFIDTKKCLNCGRCGDVCPCLHVPEKYKDEKYVYGGYNRDRDIRFESTSGGAFSAIVNAFCDENYVIFGAEADGLNVFHSYICNKRDLYRFRKSKYSQSRIGSAYQDVRSFLKMGKKVLFSGTPCQIAGLRSFLGKICTKKLLTVEVVCEGVPSPLYVRKLDTATIEKLGQPINALDYRYTGKSLFFDGMWDFEKMKIESGKNTMVCDRWFNPFWSIWLQHLMSRPSCYQCSFTTADRVADITLGDLWGVHIYCPELYGKNGGASLVICNTEKGKSIFKQAENEMFGHELKYKDVIRYQGPLRKPISYSPQREAFMRDLESDLKLKEINKKWAKKPDIKLLFQKYVWGNRQKVTAWKLKSNVRDLLKSLEIINGG